MTNVKPRLPASVQSSGTITALVFFPLYWLALLFSEIIDTRGEEHVTLENHVQRSAGNHDPKQKYRQGSNLVEATLKNVLSRLTASILPQVAQTPRGKVNPHQPMLKGKCRIVARLMRAKHTHTRANPHMIMPVNTPRMYRASAPRATSTPAALKTWVCGKSFTATLPSCWMPKPPCPRGPTGRKTDTITSLGGRE